jgi:hypothetical protein
MVVVIFVDILSTNFGGQETQSKVPRECSYFEAKKYIADRVSIVSCLLQQAECSSTQARPFGLRRLDKAESWFRFSLCHTDKYERDVTLF